LLRVNVIKMYHHKLSYVRLSGIRNESLSARQRAG